MNWYEYTTSVLLNLSLGEEKDGRGVFHKTHDDGLVLYIVLHVDVSFLTSSNNTNLENFKIELSILILIT